MRCIEIGKSSAYLGSAIRLTLTWDVLKFVINALNKADVIRLTLTWDVLKCLQNG